MNPEQNEYKTPMEMKSINSLFLRHKDRLRPPQQTIEKACIEVFTEVANIKLSKSQISYRVGTRTVIVSAPSVIKSELKFYRSEILEQLKRELGAKNSPIEIM